jgi:hypothetical protein
MALVSPGVEVTIIDQSQYLPAASNSVPFILLATAQNKANATGTGVAAATTAANSNKLYTVTSQRDLVNLFGTPFFYKTTNGTSIQGYELNEYGLLAAYSALGGTTNRAYVLRADIDLGSLVGTLSRPVGDPADGTYWLNTTSSDWGIYEFNATTGKFTNKIPTVITDSQYIDPTTDYPVESIGVIGSYAVIPLENLTGGSYSKGTYFYKNIDNLWSILGDTTWRSSIPLVTGTETTPSLSSGDSFTINVSGNYSAVIEIGSSSWGVDNVVNAINSIDDSYLIARNISGALNIYYGAPGVNNYLLLSNTTNTPLTDLGITTGVKYSPETYYGTSANMPLWTSSQTYPHPTGSVWVKTSISGAGLSPIVSKYSASTDSWVSNTVYKYNNIQTAIADLSSDGGSSIPTGTIVALYGDVLAAPWEDLTFYEKTAVGPTIATGTVANPVITSGFLVNVSVTNDDGSYTTYNLTTTGTTADDFATAWLSTNILNTDCTVTSSGAIQITHTRGGAIFLSDRPTIGQSNGILEEIGFEASGSNVVPNGILTNTEIDIPPSSTTSASGDGLTATIFNKGAYYEWSITTGGTGYQVGDEVTYEGFDIGGVTGPNDLTLTVQTVTSPTGAVTGLSFKTGVPRTNYASMISNFSRMSFIPNEGAPATTPLNNTNWFYSTATQVDIMVNKNGGWYGYKNVNYDENGHPIPSGSNATDPLGPIISTTEPTLQTDGSALVYGDLWIDTSDLENYPKLSRWQSVAGQDAWVLIDNADQTSQSGVLFADARWGNSGAVDPVSDPLVSITTLLTSNYLDLDVPDPGLYPQGMLLFNTRRSGYNVKQFRTNYFTSANYPDSVLPTYSYTWVSASGLQANGAAYMGRKAQRNMVTKALKAAIGTNQSIREEDTFFNLITCPNYPELQPDMVALNNDRNNTAYIIGDTPLRLSDQATDISAWANNTAGATSTGEDGWVTRDTYLGVFYPSGITTDLTGSAVVVPASHMMLRTLLKNDSIAYPWLAPAGTRRGIIDNATNIGYLDATTGEFVTIKNRMSIRDVLYTNQINPLAYFTGVGLLNYGNKNSFDSQSSLDRINVARLVCYIRERLQIAARPFVFEPNDAVTRNEISGVVQSLFIDLVAKRGLYDYLVVCDESNNTPSRIDRNELWIDVAIEPVKAAEFIYIPVRVLNTGEIAGLQQ